MESAEDAAAASAELTRAAQLEVLAEENRRLRREYARARQSQYQRTAGVLGLLGGIAVAGGIALPATREILFALGAVGLFGGCLTYYLTPAQFIAASVGERVYKPLSANQAALVAELGLSDERLYLPDTGHSARLFVPQHSEHTVPDIDAVSGPILTADDHRGLLLETTGTALLDEFDKARTGNGRDLSELALPTVGAQLADGVVEQFELAQSVTPDVDIADGRVTFEVVESAFGDLRRIDHPVPSFLSVGIAVAQDQPVTVDVTSMEGSESNRWLVTCRWDAESG